MSLLHLVLSVLCALVALRLVYLIVRDRQLDDPTFYALLALEAGLVVQLVVGIVRLSGPHAGVNVAAYVGYLLGALVILPVGFVWAAAEKSRSGTGVLLVAVIVLPVLFLRLHDLWEATRG
ncbi:hypothetical protein D9V37_07750 [Nocardioides mangrovicus]|uniref:Integral membrane protein n=1 Tax=Nocardioides mangrovicus TaxID=2478913 RepID=A0A3L8P412_9ACTN|nr:hypothetical protein [Nocardioides mangrovicus]RLV49782.1 hypothetical protein D9V37_07750 [Nocardioides mangrovicus]